MQETSTSGNVGAHDLTPSPSNKEQRLPTLDQLHASRSVDVLLSALQTKHETVRMAALFALARLGDPRSLPALDSIVAEEQASARYYTLHYAQVVAARIRATEGKPAANVAELQRQMQALLKHAGITAEEANTILRNPTLVYHRQSALVRKAVGQLADMALMASKQGVPKPASVSPIDLSLTPGARIKAELSEIPPEQHIAFLVSTLANKQAIKGEDTYRIQLLIDEGPLAEEPIIQQLEVMLNSNKQYGGAGFQALLQVLRGIGGPKCLPIVTKLQSHPDSWVCYSAANARRAITTDEHQYPLVDY